MGNIEELTKQSQEMQDKAKIALDEAERLSLHQKGDKLYEAFEYLINSSSYQAVALAESLVGDKKR